MSTPIPSSTHPGKRYALLKTLNNLFWGLVFVLPIAFVFYFLSPFFSDLEKATLDFRLAKRSADLVPDPNIVIIGVDRETENLVRHHPELNIPGIPLPRERLAQIVRYLKHAGASQIIVDLDIVEPKAGDEPLAHAIHESGNVVTAVRFENPFTEYLHENAYSQYETTISSTWLIQHWLSPYLLGQGNFYSHVLQQPLPNPLTLGFGPYFQSQALLSIPEESWQAYIQNQLAQSFFNIRATHNWRQTFLALSSQRAMAMSEAQMFDAHYLNLCMRQNYLNSNAPDSRFLQLLTQSRLQAFTHSITEETAKRMTYCFAKPLVESIMPAVQKVGVVSVIKDEDARLRKVPLFYRGYQGQYYPYLALQVLLQEWHGTELTLTDSILTLRDQEGRQKRIPLVNDRFLIINWKNPVRGLQQNFQSAGIDKNIVELSTIIRSDANNRMMGGGKLYRHISAIDVLQAANGYHFEEHRPETLDRIIGMPAKGAFSFQNKTVFIGDTVNDIHDTPLGQTTFGVEVLASAYDTLKNDQVFVQPAPAVWVYGLTTVLALLLVWLSIRAESILLGFGFGITMLLLYWGTAYGLFMGAAYWMPIILPSAILLTVLIAATLYRYYVHDQDINYLTRVFSNYVSPQVLSKILANPEHAQETLRGQKKEITVIFTDIKGFTSQFSEDNAETVMSQLAQYFDALIEVILNHEGTYDKFMGDGLIAFFGSPVETLDHAQKACQTALAMQKALAKLNKKFIAEGLKPLAHGVGISTGEVFVGNFGSSTIKNYTVMGTAVNLGSRLQTLTRTIDKDILISEATYRIIQAGFKTECMGSHLIRGFVEAVPVYSLEED